MTIRDKLILIKEIEERNRQYVEEWKRKCLVAWRFRKERDE